MTARTRMHPQSTAAFLRHCAATGAAVLLALAGNVAAQADEAPVETAPTTTTSDDPAPAKSDSIPLHSAFILAHRPQARMIDDTTCELIAGVLDPDGRPYERAGIQVALFRDVQPATTRPFVRVATREDGLIIARFPAKPNEVIHGRTVRTSRNPGQPFYGPGATSICHRGIASVGEAESVEPPETP